VQSAVLRLRVVCRSLCLSVTLVDQDHIGWKSWKLIARTTNPTPSLFVAQRPSTYSQGNMGKFGETRGGWKKVAYWSTKAAISLKRIKIEEKLLCRAYRNSPTLFRTVPSSTSYGFPFPQPQPKTAIAIISGTGKATDCKFGRYIHRVHPKKVHETFERKGSVDVSRDYPNFSSTPLSQERVKLRNSNLAGTSTGSIRTKAQYKFGRKGAWAYPGTAQIFEYPLLS